jgi:murein DD-endopeptidase MepM/ murein hydrolase activator NlpD
MTLQIIVVSDRLATAKTLTITGRHLVAGGIGAALLILGLSAGISYLTLRHAAELRLPFLEAALSSVHQQEMQRTQDFVRDNVSAIATKVGQIQAQILHLDTLGERLSSMAGIKPADLSATKGEPAKGAKGAPAKTGPGGQGGPLIEFQQPVTTDELGGEVERLMHLVEQRTDFLTAVEASLVDKRANASRMPTALPVNSNWNSSAFGWRVDPFTGQRAMHEGVDFSGEVGSPIVAAAGGVVVAAERHPQYGNLVEVDHGNDYTTRYAHCERILVSLGQVVKRGQKVATLGTTGRSTGPHLHFEVRYRGAAQNPSQFLSRASAPAKVAAR